VTPPEGQPSPTRWPRVDEEPHGVARAILEHLHLHNAAGTPGPHWEKRMITITDEAHPLKTLGGRHRAQPPLLERVRAYLLGPRASVLESRDEAFDRALERAFAEFAREMRGG
jgi:hypothetical protein